MCESNPSDEMASFEVLNHDGNTDSLLEFSIIQDEPPAGEDNLLNSNLDQNVQSALMSSSQDLSVQEIQERILGLARDNASMKEALEWNNVMMKEQLETISAWHNEMTTSMSKQQLSLKEATEKVAALEKENIELREKLQQLEASPKQADAPIPTQDSRSIQTVSHEEEVDKLIAELKLIIDNQSIEIDNLKKAVLEKESLNTTCELQQKENDELKNKCVALETQLKDYQDKGTERSDTEIQSLKSTISNLETQILLERHATEEEKIKHEDTRRILSVTEAKFHRVSNLLKDRNHENPPSFESSEKKFYLEQIDNLTAQLFDKQEKLEEREEKVIQLTSQLQTVNKDSESIPVLKSQVEVFKMDLSRITQAKEEASAEIQRLNQVVKDMQARLNASPAVDGDGPSRPKGGKFNGKLHVSGAARQGSKLYFCPLCNFGFTDAQAAQNHANKCLDDAQVH